MATQLALYCWACHIISSHTAIHHLAINGTISPAILTSSHVLRLVNKVKSLLDAYQGPYKNNFNIRYWSGLQLLIRLVILTAVALNVTRNKAVNLFLISLVLSLVLLMSMTLQITKVYRNKLQNCLELFFLGNLIVFTLSSQFLLSNKTHKMKGQAIITSCMVGSAFAVCLLILIDHCYSFCFKVPSFQEAYKKSWRIIFKTTKRNMSFGPIHPNRLKHNKQANIHYCGA